MDGSRQTDRQTDRLVRILSRTKTLHRLRKFQWLVGWLIGYSEVVDAGVAKIIIHSTGAEVKNFVEVLDVRLLAQ